MRRAPLATLVFSVAAVSASLAKVPSAQTDSVRRSISGLSIPFVANEGQTDPRVAFTAQTFAGTVFVTREGKIVYSLPAERSGPGVGGWSLTESFVGGRPRPAPGRPAVTRVSYFLGTDPTRWKSGLATHDAVNLGEVWEAITVSLHAHGDNVEKLFTVHPGGEASRIRMRVAGARSLRTNKRGALVAVTGLGEVTFTRPVAYQERDGVRRAVAVAYRAQGQEYGFSLSGHDPALPVVIDPLLQATYLGGSSSDANPALAIHPTSGEAYVTGATGSTDFPGTTGGAQPASGTGGDAFVARLNAALTTLLQATYLGGSGGDAGLALAVHPTSGEIYVAGTTDSSNFPGTVGGAQPAIAGPSDAFVARLNAALTTLNQATYLGGSGGDIPEAIAIHPTSGEAYVAGRTGSTDFPGTVGGAQAAPQDTFVARLNAALTALNQATYLGGSGSDQGRAIAIHPTSGEAYVTGLTSSTDFPGTAGGAQPAIAGPSDAFVARLNAALTTLNQATYLGGTAQDDGRGLAIHPTSGEVYVAGNTASTNFPGTAGGAQPASGTGGDAFVARLNAALTTLTQASYLGGSGGEEGFSVGIHPASGEAYVAGLTRSSNFPGTAGGAQPALGGTRDAFIARLNASLTTLNQATYLGSSGTVDGVPIAFHPTSGDVYVAGDTLATNFPGTAGGAQPALAGSRDIFVARLTADLAGAGGPTPTVTPTVTPTPPGPTATPTVTPTVVAGTADLSVVKTDSPDPATVGGTLTYTILVTNNGPAAATAVTVTDTLPAGVTFGSATATQGACTQAAGIVTCALGTLANGASATITIHVVPTASGSLSNGVVVAAAQTDPNPGNSGSTAGTTVNPGVAASDIPVLSPMMLALLGIALAGIGVLVLRRL